MSYATLDPNKTALLFFDMLNVYFRGSSEENQRKMEPIVANCVKVREVAMELGIPSFYAKADHRPDGLDSARLYSDTSYALEPWEDPEQGFTAAYRTVHHGSWTSAVIDELAPGPGDYVIAKHRWSSFHQTHLELSLRTRGINTLVLFGRRDTHRHREHRLRGARPRLQPRDRARTPAPGPEDNLKQYMEHIFPIFARIRTADEVVEMMRPGAK